MKSIRIHKKQSWINWRPYSQRILHNVHNDNEIFDLEYGGVVWCTKILESKFDEIMRNFVSKYVLSFRESASIATSNSFPSIQNFVFCVSTSLIGKDRELFAVYLACALKVHFITIPIECNQNSSAYDLLLEFDLALSKSYGNALHGISNQDSIMEVLIDRARRVFERIKLPQKIVVVILKHSERLSSGVLGDVLLKFYELQNSTNSTKDGLRFTFLCINSASRPLPLSVSDSTRVSTICDMITSITPIELFDLVCSEIYSSSKLLVHLSPEAIADINQKFIFKNPCVLDAISCMKQYIFGHFEIDGGVLAISPDIAVLEQVGVYRRPRTVSAVPPISYAVNCGVQDIVPKILSEKESPRRFLMEDLGLIRGGSRIDSGDNKSKKKRRLKEGAFHSDEAAEDSCGVQGCDGLEDPVPFISHKIMENLHLLNIRRCCLKILWYLKEKFLSSSEKRLYSADSIWAVIPRSVGRPPSPPLTGFFTALQSHPNQNEGNDEPPSAAALPPYIVDMLSDVERGMRRRNNLSSIQKLMKPLVTFLESIQTLETMKYSVDSNASHEEMLVASGTGETGSRETSQKRKRTPCTSQQHTDTSGEVESFGERRIPSIVTFLQHCCRDLNIQIHLMKSAQGIVSSRGVSGISNSGSSTCFSSTTVISVPSAAANISNALENDSLSVPILVPPRSISKKRHRSIVAESLGDDKHSEYESSLGSGSRPAPSSSLSKHTTDNDRDGTKTSAIVETADLKKGSVIENVSSRTFASPEPRLDKKAIPPLTSTLLLTPPVANQQQAIPVKQQPVLQSNPKKAPKSLFSFAVDTVKTVCVNILSPLRLGLGHSSSQKNLTESVAESAHELPTISNQRDCNIPPSNSIRNVPEETGEDHSRSSHNHRKRKIQRKQDLHSFLDGSSVATEEAGDMMELLGGAGNFSDSNDPSTVDINTLKREMTLNYKESQKEEKILKDLNEVPSDRFVELVITSVCRCLIEIVSGLHSYSLRVPLSKQIYFDEKDNIQEVKVNCLQGVTETSEGCCRTTFDILNDSLRHKFSEGISDCQLRSNCVPDTVVIYKALASSSSKSMSLSDLLKTFGKQRTEWKSDRGLDDAFSNHSDDFASLGIRCRFAFGIHELINEGLVKLDRKRLRLSRNILAWM